MEPLNAETLNAEILKELIVDKKITPEQFQAILKEYEKLNVLTKDEIGETNLKKINEKIISNKKENEKKEKKSNKKDNSKVVVGVVFGLLLIVMGLTVPGLGIMPFVMGSALLISFALRVMSKLIRSPLKDYINDVNFSDPGKVKKWSDRISRKNTNEFANLMYGATLLSGGIYGLFQGITLGTISMMSALIVLSTFVIDNEIFEQIIKFIQGKNNEEIKNEEITQKISTSTVYLQMESVPNYNLPNPPVRNSVTSSLDNSILFMDAANSSSTIDRNSNNLNFNFNKDFIRRRSL